MKSQSEIEDRLEGLKMVANVYCHAVIKNKSSHDSETRQCYLLYLSQIRLLEEILEIEQNGVFFPDPDFSSK